MPCVRNSSYTSSYSLLPILLKLHRCFGHGLKHACGLDIILSLFIVTLFALQVDQPPLPFWKLSMDRGYVVCATSTVLY